MKLQQLRYIVEVFSHTLNVSMAAKTLGASQPSMSKQIRQLEDSLGVQIFERHGKHFTTVTPAGKKLIRIAREILTKVDNLNEVAFEQTHPEQGSLTIAAASNQLRYQMPSMISTFVDRYPKVTIQVYQSPPSKIVEAMKTGEVDLIVLTEVGSVYEELLMLPCYHWQLMVVMRKDHRLASEKQVSIEELTNERLVSCPPNFFGQPIMEALFNYSELSSRIVFTAADPELLKSYVR